MDSGKRQGILHIADLIHYNQSRGQYYFSYLWTCIEYLLCARLYGRKYGFGNLESGLQLLMSTEEKCTPGKNQVDFTYVIALKYVWKSFS